MSTNNMDRFEFRCIRPEETQQAIEIEQICFPPNEACSPKSLTERIKATAETFLVAEDKETGKLAAFLNGVPTDEEGRELVSRYCQKEAQKGRKKLFLTCLDEKVKMYEKFGFTDLGQANSTWGGEAWHAMSIEIGR